MNQYGRVFVIHKSYNNYKCKIIESSQLASGSESCNLTKGSSKLYYGSAKGTKGEGNNMTIVPTKQKYIVIDGNLLRGHTIYEEPPYVEYTYDVMRVWPEDFNSYNAKFEKKEKPKDKFTPSSGTAFFVTKKGHVITNFHVVEGCKDKSKIIYEDNEIKVKLLAKDKYLDLALLKANIENKHFIKISNKSPKKLQRIIAAGYPFGKELSDDLKFTSGIVSSLKGLQDDSTRIQIDAALNYGNSGGPIVDEKTGELVAVAVAGLSKEVTESINFGIKAGSVKNFLDSNQINTSLTASKYSFGSVDLSAILENATVYTFCK